jgi:Na+-translocating ferredoxin:NAD+ oxidoreductase RnfG subunit
MKTRFLYGTIFVGLLALVYGVTANTHEAQAADAKNLKVLPANTSKKDLKNIMKKVSSALGVQCEYCHDMKDMAKDTEKKQVARAMFTMVGDINKKYFKGKSKVSCMTCHNGAAEPK